MKQRRLAVRVLERVKGIIMAWLWAIADWCGMVEWKERE